MQAASNLALIKDTILNLIYRIFPYSHIYISLYPTVDYESSLRQFKSDWSKYYYHGTIPCTNSFQLQNVLCFWLHLAGSCGPCWGFGDPSWGFLTQNISLHALYCFTSYPFFLSSVLPQRFMESDAKWAWEGNSWRTAEGIGSLERSRVTCHKTAFILVYNRILLWQSIQWPFCSWFIPDVESSCIEYSRWMPFLVGKLYGRNRNSFVYGSA